MDLLTSFHTRDRVRGFSQASVAPQRDHHDESYDLLIARSTTKQLTGRSLFAFGEEIIELTVHHVRAIQHQPMRGVRYPHNR